MADIRCRCGGTYRRLPDLEGLTCDRCGKSIEGDVDSITVDSGYDPSSAFSPDKLKEIRGVDLSSFTIGTQSKGCISIYFPPYLSASEQTALIDSELEVLAHAKAKVAELGLDIYSGKRRSEE